MCKKIKTLTVILSVVPLVFLCVGCLINDLNIDHYKTYYDSGLKHLNAEDYGSAKILFARAYNYAQAGFLGSEAEAAALYNYALAVGHLGDFQQAEDCLKRTIALDEKAEGKDATHASMRLFELARLYQAWGQNSQAIETYEKAFSLAGKQNVIKTDPIGYAVVLNDYAIVLKKAGFAKKTELVESEAQKIRDANPSVEPKVKIRYYPTK
jgi:tetratricopeptide (TPR) repeat protein